jgi:uncharacterized protein DUF2846
MRQVRPFLLAMVSLVALAACATGAKFQTVDTIPPGKAVIYIYRPSSLGAAITYDVKHKDRVVITTKAFGYYPYVTDPGEVELSAQTESKSSVTLDVKPGEIYYVKAVVSMGFLVGRPRLVVVSADEAKKDIAECKLLVKE